MESHIYPQDVQRELRMLLVSERADVHDGVRWDILDHITRLLRLVVEHSTECERCQAAFQFSPEDVKRAREVGLLNGTPQFCDSCLENETGSAWRLCPACGKRNLPVWQGNLDDLLLIPPFRKLYEAAEADLSRG